MNTICDKTIDSFPDIVEAKEKLNDGCPVCRATEFAKKVHSHTCGHGTFCRDGLYQLFLIPEDIQNGRGTPEDLEVLRESCELIEMGNDCTMSRECATLIKESLDSHASEWSDHVTRKRCKSLECPGGYTIYIDPMACDGCSKCLAAAPEGAIAGGEGMIHIIKKDLLEMKTQAFFDTCPQQAIKKVGMVRPMIPVEPVPVGSFGQNSKGGDGLPRRRRGSKAEAKQMEADVVVVACGMSGLAASIQAQESLNQAGGGKVVAFEKSGTVGGAANMGMAFLAIESQLQKETMTNDFTKDDAFNFFMEYTHWRSDAKLVRRWFNMSGDTYQWIKNMGVEFQGVYKYFKNSHATQHMIKAPGTNKPTERCAANMIQKMSDYAKELGVEIKLHTAVKEIMVGSKGQVRGVKVVTEDGEEIECLCNSVIVATGGMGNNVDMIEQYMGWKWGEDMFTFRIPGLDGDGMRMVWAIGGKKAPVNMEVTYNTPGTTDVFKTLSEVMRQPNLLVNLDGKRFFNEELMDNTTYTGNALLQQKKHCGVSIIDSGIVEYYKEHGLDYITYHHDVKTMDNWEKEKELFFAGAKGAAENSVFASDAKEVSYGAEDMGPNFFEAQTIEELAEKTGVNCEKLKKTIEEYNAMCNGFANGYDHQFTKDHRYLKPILKAPFYAAKHYPSGYGSLGGIQVNENMQVLNTELDPIPGLYASGTDSATVFADSYCFYNPGSTMSYALNSGRIAGMESVKYMDSDEFIDPEV